MKTHCTYRNTYKRCFVNKYEAQMAASEIPDIKHVYKCQKCHWWHLTSKGRGKRLPDWVKRRQEVVGKPLVEEKLEKVSKYQKELLQSTLPISKQKEIYKLLSNQKPQRSLWSKIKMWITL